MKVNPDLNFSSCFTHAVEVKSPRTGKVLGWRIVREYTQEGTFLTREEAVAAMAPMQSFDR